MSCALLATSEAHSSYIAPASATGSGSFADSPSLIIDGFIPPRQSYYATSAVSWGDLATSFTVDFGSVQTVGSLVASFDNNDDYRVEYSTDGVHFSNLFTFLGSDGPVTEAEGGLEVLTTDPAYPSMATDLSTPEYVGRTFDPVSAQYLRISAIRGDGFYSVAELDAFTPAVPEPSSLLMLGMGGVGVAFGLRRRPR
jgi:hypothetical protein